MVQSKICYIVICDGCGIQFKHSSPYDDSQEAWDNPEVAICAAEDGNWKTIEGKIYCEDHWHLDKNFKPKLNAAPK